MLASILALALGAQPCWGIYDDAMRHRAASAHPGYISYQEHTQLVEDGAPYYSTDVAVMYRDDGLARVLDSQILRSELTDRVQPGPPVLGPYGPNREAWLPVQASGSPSVIAEVRKHTASCVDRGIERYRGHDTYHLVIVPADASKPAVKAVWVDAQTAEIWKIIVSGHVALTGPSENNPLVDFEVELAPEGQYVVVQHITWSYQLRWYHQATDFFGEYTFSNFTYPEKLPDSLFASTAGPA